jgi:hypothetical protein
VSDWIEGRPGVVRIRVRAQPRASRTEITGEREGALRIRVAAPPVEGEANAALIRFIAKRLGIAPSRVRLISGETGRQKTFEVQDLDPATVRAALWPDA